MGGFGVNQEIKVFNTKDFSGESVMMAGSVVQHILGEANGKYRAPKLRDDL
jgi:hypothetical protein